MKRKPVVIAVILLFAVIACVFAWRMVSSYSIALTANWGFSPPKEAGCSEIYSSNSGASPHGDGIRYHIFSYESEKPVEEMLEWSTFEREMIFNASYSEAIEEWLGRIAVPGEYWPSITECVYHYERQEDNSEIIVFWNRGRSRLYILESFL